MKGLANLFLHDRLEFPGFRSGDGLTFHRDDFIARRDTRPPCRRRGYDFRDRGAAHSRIEQAGAIDLDGEAEETFRSFRRSVDRSRPGDAEGDKKESGAKQDGHLRGSFPGRAEKQSQNCGESGRETIDRRAEFAEVERLRKNGVHLQLFVNRANIRGDVR